MVRTSSIFSFLSHWALWQPIFASTPLILDSYGGAVQLRHALNAAQRQGSLVMVLDRSNEIGVEIWVVSTAEHDLTGNTDNDTTSHLRKPKRNNEIPASFDEHGQLQEGYDYKGSEFFMRPLVSSFSHSFPGSDISRNRAEKLQSDVNPSRLRDCENVAVVCVGVHGDAKWLLGQLQEYATLVWERTGNKIDVNAVLPAISALFRTCSTQYPFISKSFGPSLQQLLRKISDDEDDDNNNNEDRSPWARPLGVSALVLDLSAATVKQSLISKEPTRIYQIDPSGLVQPIYSKYVCVGKHSLEMQECWQNYSGRDWQAKSDLEVCQILCQGLAHCLGSGKIPSLLRIEVYAPQKRIKSIQRCLVSIKELETKDPPRI